jgi:hypothetical protein
MSTTSEALFTAFFEESLNTLATLYENEDYYGALSKAEEISKWINKRPLKFRGAYQAQVDSVTDAMINKGIDPIITKIGTRKQQRNESCKCGSGKKFKKCCFLKEEDKAS